MATTYEKIATTTLGSATNTITFSSIANTWTDLRLVFVKSGGSATNLLMQFNSDTGANYGFTWLSADGSAAYSGRNSNANYVFLGNLYVSFGTGPMFAEIDIFSYAGSTYKTSLSSRSTDKNGTGELSKTVGLWLSTSAITSVTLYSSSGTYDAGSIATLYGIKKA